MQCILAPQIDLDKIHTFRKKIQSPGPLPQQNKKFIPFPPRPKRPKPNFEDTIEEYPPKDDYENSSQLDVNDRIDHPKGKNKQLHADCLNEIFKYLDTKTLRSCLLVNHLWCENAVRFLWRDVLSFSVQAISSLIACLPDESKVLLSNNGIFIPTPTSKRPLFNYVSYCRVLSIRKIDQMIQNVLKKQQQSIISRSLGCSKYLLSKEILKMFMNQIPSLKSLEYDSECPTDIMFTYFPGANNCLLKLTELVCTSNMS